VCVCVCVLLCVACVAWGSPQVAVGKHPFIVKLFSYWATDKRLYFLMEYVDVRLFGRTS